MIGDVVPTKKGSTFSFLLLCRGGDPDGVLFPIGEADWLSPLNNSGGPAGLCVDCAWTSDDSGKVSDGCIETTTEYGAERISCVTEKKRHSRFPALTVSSR